MDDRGDFVPYPCEPGDDVQGYMTMPKVLALIAWACSLEPKT